MTRQPVLRAAGLCLIALVLGLSGFAVAGGRAPGLWLLWAGLVCWLAEALIQVPSNTGGPGVRWFGAALLAAAACLGGLATMSVGGLGWALVIAALIRTIKADRGWPVLIVVGISGILGLVGGSLVGQQPYQLLTGLLTCSGTVLVSLLRRNSRRTAEQEQQLLRQQVEAERQRAENAALSERARLAGDLHDVLAHSLGALTAQLNAAEALLDADRITEARQRVTASRELAADGLAEARRAVAALREPAAFDNSLAELARVHRESGETLTVETSGTPQRLSPAAEQAARRVVQELLTNARKHAPGQPVDLEVSWSDGRLTISASNPLGPGSLGLGSGYPGGLGHGLTAMRERSRRLGGDVQAGRTPDDEFSVTCSFPTEA